MEPILRIAAVFGVLIALTQLGRAGWRLLRGGVDALVAGQIARTRADRGDLTGMREAEREVKSARRYRLRAGLEVGIWASLLAVPPFTRWTLHAWASVAALWIVLRVAGGEKNTTVAGQGSARR